MLKGVCRACSMLFILTKPVNITSNFINGLISIDLQLPAQFGSAESVRQVQGFPVGVLAVDQYMNPEHTGGGG